MHLYSGPIYSITACTGTNTMQLQLQIGRVRRFFAFFANIDTLFQPLCLKIGTHDIVLNGITVCANFARYSLVMSRST